MKINILFFGPLSKACGCRSYTLDVNSGNLKLRELEKRLLDFFPQLEKFKYTFAVNQCIAGKNTVVNEGDEIALLPPISGGNINYVTEVKITDDFIQKQLNSIKNNAGSLLTFRGIVRADNHGENRSVSRIIYSAYNSMAEKEIAKIVETAIKKYGLLDVIVKHRTGAVEVGETAFFVAVYSLHRKEGIAAIDFIIDEVKSRIPVWKEEFFTDGESAFKDGYVLERR